MIYKNGERMRDFLGLCFYCSLVFYILGGVFNKTIIPLALVGYEMIIANEAHNAELAIIISYPTSASGIIVKYFCPKWRLSCLLSFKSFTQRAPF